MHTQLSYFHLSLSLLLSSIGFDCGCCWLLQVLSMKSSGIMKLTLCLYYFDSSALFSLSIARAIAIAIAPQPFEC